ncbi:hypothetical protein Phum_PHUM346870 [Pediculus humanus corporis]|uniref:Uncharacterized protein n=1 Tax=Pediculus humanus subsp. corporis TaxID=121224 RepID=E0VNW5_PEDHC|nr:uncharacterized protein Phum_PHUM346870 [Pediculus humanus corporis]EEB15071.1 hypothetical protein Phum_PHUM346870 [Pediculus humanus corporis]
MSNMVQMCIGNQKEVFKKVLILIARGNIKIIENIQKKGRFRILTWEIIPENILL